MKPPDTSVQNTVRELPLDKLEKLGEMIAKLKNDDKHEATRTWRS